jgi:hypothetical protein
MKGCHGCSEDSIGKQMVEALLHLGSRLLRKRQRNNLVCGYSLFLNEMGDPFGKYARFPCARPRHYQTWTVTVGDGRML